MKSILRKFLSVLLTVCILGGTLTALSGCGEEKSYTSLDGKKFIFIGDSFVYFGQTVLEKTQDNLGLENRVNDTGYFYQLCKANGEQVSVTNFTFGGHGIHNFRKEACTTERPCKGANHLEHLTDRVYDYVVLSGGRHTTAEATFLEDVEFFMELFREANPDVKFVYLCSSGAHNVTTTEPTFPKVILNNLKTIEQWGVTVVDWGAIVADVVNGVTEVPGATQDYYKYSFVISNSAKDGYHPNPLAGYITTLMTYCAVTGRSAVGQPYYFCGDDRYSNDPAYRTFEKFTAKYYKYGQIPTNYAEAFASEADMRGFQELIDRYLSEAPYREYDFK